MTLNQMVFKSVMFLKTTGWCWYAAAAGMSGFFLKLQRTKPVEACERMCRRPGACVDLT